MNSSHPRLILLVPTAKGMAPFRMHVFSSMEPAERFIRTLNPPGLGTTVIAFWALRDRREATPETGRRTQPVVLATEPATADLVDLVLFTNMEDAQAFARSAVEDGIALDRLRIYWAAMVCVAADGEGYLHLLPNKPPSVLSELRAPTPRR